MQRLCFDCVYIYVIYKYWSGTVLLFRFQGWLVLRRDWVPVSDFCVFPGTWIASGIFPVCKKNWAGTILGQGLSPQPLKVYTIRLFFLHDYSFWCLRFELHNATRESRYGRGYTIFTPSSLGQPDYSNSITINPAAFFIILNMTNIKAYIWE